MSTHGDNFHYSLMYNSSNYDPTGRNEESKKATTTVSPEVQYLYPLHSSFSNEKIIRSISPTLRSNNSSFHQQHNSDSPLTAQSLPFSAGSRMFATLNTLTTDQIKVTRDLTQSAHDTMLKILISMRVRKEDTNSLRQAWCQFVRCWYERGVRATARQKALAVRRVSTMYEQKLKSSHRRNGISVLVAASHTWRRKRLQFAWARFEVSTGTGSARAATEHQALRWTSSIGIVRRFMHGCRSKRVMNAWFVWKQCIFACAATEAAEARAANRCFVGQHDEKLRLANAKAADWECEVNKHKDALARAEAAESSARETHERQVSRMQLRLARERQNAVERQNMTQQTDAARHRLEVSLLTKELGTLRETFEATVDERVNEAQKTHAEEKALMHSELHEEHRQKEALMEQRHLVEIWRLSQEVEGASLRHKEYASGENERLRAELERSEETSKANMRSLEARHVKLIRQVESKYEAELNTHRARMDNVEAKARSAASKTRAILARTFGVILFRTLLRLVRNRLRRAWMHLRANNEILQPPERDAPAPPVILSLPAAVPRDASKSHPHSVRQEKYTNDDELFFSPLSDANEGHQAPQRAVKLTGAFVEPAIANYTEASSVDGHLPPSFDGLKCPECGRMHAWTASVCEDPYCGSPLRIDNDLVPPPEVRCEIPFLKWLAPKNRRTLDSNLDQRNTSPPPYCRSADTNSSPRCFEDAAKIKKRPQKRPPRRALSGKSSSLPPRLGGNLKKSQHSKISTEKKDEDILVTQKSNEEQLNNEAQTREDRNFEEGQPTKEIGREPFVTIKDEAGEGNLEEKTSPQNAAASSSVTMPTEATVFSTLGNIQLHHLAWEGGQEVESLHQERPTSTWSQDGPTLEELSSGLLRDMDDR